MGAWLSKPAKSDMLKVTQTSPSDWKYVSEGGATIVFSYIGPPDTGFDGTVLRLRKALVPVPLASAGAKDDKFDEPRTPVTASTDDEPDDPTIEYQAKCMSKLIPLEHLPRLENVALDEPWLEQLVEIQNLKRPEIRRERDGIDLDRKKGVLATDLVGGDWLAVEIKPKWAFLPSPAHLSDATRPIKLHTCRFCMHNHLRETKGEIIPMKYCPLDLFSNDEDRMKKAVDGLWDAWTESGGTVNNLKVFAHGHLLRPSDADRMLVSELQGKGVDIEAVRDTFKTNLVKTLRSTPVLGILSKLQRTLDALDIEGLSKLWRHTERAAPLYRTTFASFFNDEQQDPNAKPPPSTPLGVSSLFLSEPEPNISDWQEFLNTYLSEFSAQLDHAKPDPQHLRYYLLAYLLSATFKDCSIIARLDFLRLGQEAQVEIRKNTVTVIDLDPKSMVKLRGWEKLDREIVTTYAQREDRKLCVDAGKL